jgi:uncharacterized membrane protein YfcA
LLALGFPVGGIAGASLAARASAPVLQWSYVVYLTLLVALATHRSSPSHSAGDGPGRAMRAPSLGLVMVGLLAGSGYLGIGGGLAVVVGLVGVFRMPQHQAQLMSLLLSLIPTTLPAACVYWRTGALPTWPVLVAVMLGLWVGTDIGARAANRLNAGALRGALVTIVGAMATCMVWRAIAHR